ncbi:hypothetical protein N7445_010915 [Penicillium cf. griseofulvum]|nr:hypothetical protein N7445_010915 [Penicillium cf. griseofulvum]
MSSNGQKSSTFNSDGLQSFFKQFTVLASSPQCQAASIIFEKIDNQREQICARDEELKKAQNEIHDLKEKKRVAIEEMFAANESEKAKQKEALARVESLSATNTEKDKSLADCSKQLQGLRQQLYSLKSSYSLEVEKASQSAKEISTLQQDLKEQEKTIDKMRAASSNLQTKLLLEQQKTKELEAEKVSLGKELEASRGQLQTLESFTVQQVELEENSMQVNLSIKPHLWNFALSEISITLREDLHENVLKDKSTYDKLRVASAKYSQQHVPLVSSNSLGAKGMRLAVTLAILSREICQHIFQSNYILPEDSEIHGILSQLTENDPEKESFCRRVLLSIDQNAEQSILQARIQTVIRNMSSYLWTLLSEDQLDAVRISIEEVAQRATKFWLPIQRAQQRYETAFELVDLVDEDWKSFRFPGDDEIPNRQDQVVGDRDVNILTVFPCISLVKDGHRDPLTQIVQLRSTQKLFMEAVFEASQTNFVVPRRSSTRTRRQSIAQNTDRQNGTSFLEGKSPKP